MRSALLPTLRPRWHPTIQTLLSASFNTTTACARALQQSLPKRHRDKALELATVVVIFTNGLWTMSRSVSDGDVLRRVVQNFLDQLAKAAK